MLTLFLAAALSGPIAMVRPTAVRPAIQAYPRIARPANAAERRINAAVARLDAQVRQGWRRCVRDNADGNMAGIHRATWRRQVEATMSGPEFVSYSLWEDVDCGGAYPYLHTSAIVYDKRTGAPVDWRALLPPRLTGDLTLEEGPDGVRTVQLGADRLAVLYNERVDAVLRATAAPDTCGGISNDNGEPAAFGGPMTAWLDARTGGLAIQYVLNHASEACSVPVVLPIELLRREGASPRLIDALTAAHAAARQR